MSSTEENASDNKEYEISLDMFSKYMQYKVPVAISVGGLSGSAFGYYVGDMMALYGYSYAFGLGIGTTAFYSGTFILRSVRKKDDVFNYGASGFFNGAWIITGISGMSS